MHMYLIGQGQGRERGNTFGPLDAHEKEARRRLAHGLRRHLVQVHGGAADFVGVLQEAQRDQHFSCSEQACFTVNKQRSNSKPQHLVF